MTVRADWPLHRKTAICDAKSSAVGIDVVASARRRRRADKRLRADVIETPCRKPLARILPIVPAVVIRRVRSGIEGNLPKTEYGHKKE